MRLLTIFLLLLFPFPSLASVAQVKADSYTPGPVFHLSNGHTLTVQFAGFSSDVIDNLTAALNVYVPKLLQMFYEPSVDYTVTINHGDGCVGEGYAGCSGPAFTYLTHDWDSDPRGWPDKISVLVHELTLTLQFAPNGPASVLQDDAFMFYGEPTADDMQDILVPQPDLNNPHFGYYWDSALGSANYGVEVAAAGYRGIATNPRAGVVSRIMWLGLYRADHGIFRRVNNLLSQLAQQGGPLIKADGLREVIRQSLSLQTLDGLPVRQWLAAEGMLTRDEAVSFSTTPVFIPAGYENVQVGRAVSVDGAKSNAIFYDAVTRIPIGESAYAGTTDYWGFDDGQFWLGRSEYVHSASRADIHLVTSTGVYDRSFLLPLFDYPRLIQSWSVDDALENAVVLATPDGWLRLVNGTARVNGQAWPVVNGVLRLITATPTVNIDLPNGRRIENFVTDGTLMVLGAFNITALQLMHNTDQISPATTTAQSTSLPQQTATPTQPPATPRCIIATAAYGSEMAPEVVYMRYVRDRVVGSTPIGGVIVGVWNAWYYSWSPPIAVFISDKPWLRAAFRILLTPVSISVRAADLTFNAIGGGNFGSVIAFLFAAMISTLAYVVFLILAIRLTWRALTFVSRSGIRRLLRLRKPR